jgi:glutathione S-transferase
MPPCCGKLRPAQPTEETHMNQPKLYMHPVSTASRPVRLFIAEKKLPVTEQIVDLMTGEHMKDEFSSINPSKMVPALVDGDLKMTESSAILKYLASKFECAEYPRDLKKRAKVDEAMDWFNTQFYRDFAYGMVYPQVFANHKRPTDSMQDGTIAWGKERAGKWLGVLEQHYLGSSPFVCGSEMTIADYFGACVVTSGELIGCTFQGLPNVQRWLGAMKKLSTWSSVNEVMVGFAGSMKDRQFQNI